jgi:hypothetical protein
LKLTSGLHTPVKENVLEYWRKRENSPLFDLAMIVHGTPPTQCDVERDFSSVGQLISSRRTRMKDRTVDNALMIKLNSELLNNQMNYN